MPKVSIEVKADSTQAVQALDAVKGKTGELEGSLTSMSTSGGGMGGSILGAAALGAALVSLGTVAITAVISGIKDAGEALIQFGVNSIEAAASEQLAVRGVVAALESQNAASTTNIDMLDQMSQGLQKTSNFSDDAAREAAKLALNLGNTAAQAATIVPVAANVATALGMDLSAATKAASMTLDGFVDKTLKRAVPELGNLTEAELRAGKGLELLADKYVGQAAAATDTWIGKTQDLGEGWEGVSERVGDFLIDALEPFLDVGKRAIEVTDDFISSMDKKTVEEFKGVIATLATVSGVLVEGLAKVADTIRTRFLPAVEEVKGAFPGLSFLIEKAGDFFGDLDTIAKTTDADIKLLADTLGVTEERAREMAQGKVFVEDAFADMGAAAQAAADTQRQASQATIDKLREEQEEFQETADKEAEREAKRGASSAKRSREVEGEIVQINQAADANRDLVVTIDQVADAAPQMGDAMVHAATATVQAAEKMKAKLIEVVGAAGSAFTPEQNAAHGKTGGSGDFLASDFAMSLSGGGPGLSGSVQADLMDSLGGVTRGAGANFAQAAAGASSTGELQDILRAVENQRRLINSYGKGLSGMEAQGQLTAVAREIRAALDAAFADMRQQPVVLQAEGRVLAEFISERTARGEAGMRGMG
jgi:hypothetical protein